MSAFKLINFCKFCLPNQCIDSGVLTLKSQLNVKYVVQDRNKKVVGSALLAGVLRFFRVSPQSGISNSLTIDLFT